LELRELLATPAIAIALGVFVGLVLLAPVIWATRFFVSDKIDVGLAIVMGSVFAGLLVALGALFGYRAVAPDGLIWFGPSLVAGFVVGLGVFALKVAMTWFKSDDGTKG
jgi:Sec-independent protein secretion pathway component TatC